MLKGIICALSACFIWGLIFVIPLFMEGFSSIEITLVRFFFYGTGSLLIFFRAFLRGRCRYPISIWIKALYFSFFITIGYYIWVVLALRYSTPAICTLILGIMPITIAFYGNWKQKECTYKSLILPSFMILIGLIVINAPHINTNSFSSKYIFGLFSSFIALITWSWFVVSNSRFLKTHPEVASWDWSTLIGVTTLVWVAISGLFFGLLFNGQLDISKFTLHYPGLSNYLIGCMILGLICSWVGAFLWYQASFYLPVTLAGQLMIFETIFGLIFVYTLEKRMPPISECLGIVLLLSAVFFGIRALTKQQLKT